MGLHEISSFLLGAYCVSLKLGSSAFCKLPAFAAAWCPILDVANKQELHKGWQYLSIVHGVLIDCFYYGFVVICFVVCRLISLIKLNYISNISSLSTDILGTSSILPKPCRLGAICISSKRWSHCSTRARSPAFAQALITVLIRNLQGWSQGVSQTQRWDWVYRYIHIDWICLVYTV